MFDVDYHVDMPTYLASNNSPVVLYTHSPDGLCKDDGAYSYTFDEHNNFVYRTAAGRRFAHQLWRYDAAGFVACSSTRAVCYRVQRHACGRDRQLILLLPYAYFEFPFNFLMHFLQCSFIGRLRVVKLAPNGSAFTRLGVQRSDGYFICTSRPNTYVQTCIPASIDGALNTLALTQVAKPQIYSLTSLCKAANIDIRKAELVPAVAYAASGLYAPHHDVFPMEAAVRTYSFGDSIEPIKPSLSVFMHPILHAAFAPGMTLECEQRAAESRVEKFANRSIRVDAFIRQAINEFVVRVVPDDRCGLVPSTIEDVYSHQNRPIQRDILSRGQVGVVEPKVTRSTFVKREAYGNVKDPRVISTVDPALKIELSLLLYPLMEVVEEVCGFHGAGFYACGMTPKQIATRVADLCSSPGVTAVAKTDFSRFDGHFNEVGVLLEKTLYLRAFDRAYHADIETCLNATYNQRSVMSGNALERGYAFNTGTTVMSGKPHTSLIGSITNAFISFYSYRRVGLEADDAFSALGIYLGDDGLSKRFGRLTGECCPLLKVSAKRMGFELDVEWLPRGSGGIEFLARKYTTDVWEGSPVSCCDVVRQLSKLHVTANMPSNVTPPQKLYEKALAYSLTDRHTPVLGEYCVKALALLQNEGVERAVNADLQLSSFVLSYFAQFSFEHQYPNDDSVASIVQEDLEAIGFDLVLFRTVLTNACSVRDMLAFPVCAPAPAPVQVANLFMANELGHAEECADGGMLEPTTPTHQRRDSNRGTRDRGGGRRRGNNRGKGGRQQPPLCRRFSGK
jgi:hypothetical protein